MKQLTSRQAGILIFFSVIALKAVVLPAIIFFLAGAGGYITIIFSLIFDFGLLLIYLWVMKNNPDKTFPQILEDAFGKTFSKIVCAIVFVYFMLKTFLIMKSVFNFFTKAVYDNMDWVYYIISTVFFLFFAINKPLRAFGRTAEVIFWIIFISINVILIITSFTMDLTTLLPLFPNGSVPIVDTGIKSAFGFGDYTILLFFMGNIKWEANTSKKIIIYAITAIGTIINFYIVFLCNFGYSVVNQNLAIADLSLYLDLSVTVSRLEWIAVFAWTMTLIIQMIMYAYCAKESLNQILPKKIQKISPFVVLLICGGVYLIISISIQVLLGFIFSYPVSIAAMIVQVLLPLLLAIAVIIKKRKENKYVSYTAKTTI
ncbi:MAG: GerAB/ArcD/ProY family transporter [Clostridia bacterium]|nr:GerAB/ArcD/ProY family transporter [Clostridia bacterium]